MTQKILTVSINLFILLFLTSNTFACDNKSCENKYSTSTHKTIHKITRRATISQREKAEYSANYKRKQIALVNTRRAHAVVKARRRYTYNNYNNSLRHKKGSVVNVRRKHALNRARKSYALSHLKQRSHMLNSYKKVKRPSSHSSKGSETINYLNSFAQKYQKTSRSNKRSRNNSHFKKKSRLVASRKRMKKHTKHKIVLTKRSAHKSKRFTQLKKKRQKLANIKLRRADTIAREKSEYARQKHRRDLVRIDKKQKLNRKSEKEES